MTIAQSIKQAVGIAPPPALSYEALVATRPDVRHEESRSVLDTLVPLDVVNAATEALASELVRRGRSDHLHTLESRLAIRGSETRIKLEVPYSTDATHYRATEAMMVALPLAEALDLLLDEVRNPEAEIARRNRARIEAQRAHDQAERERSAEAERWRVAAQAEARRLAAWRARPRIERALLQLAKADPKWRPLLTAIEAEPETPDTVPEGF